MSKCRFDWFQTDSHVTLTIMKKGVNLDTCKACLTDGYLIVRSEDEELWSGTLSGPVDSTKFTLKCTPSKVEICMPKATPGRWASLTASESGSGDGRSVNTKKWDALEKEVAQEEENEPLEGDAAVNRMFQKIYSGASDEVKRAMMKSYSESSGTVLSTNWEEIKSKKTEVKPPDSMEFKKWD